MSVLTKNIPLSMLLLTTAMPVLAAEGERDPGNSLAIWIFLGFCALIIIAQLLPLVWHLSSKSAEQVAKQEPVLDKVPKS